MQKSYASVGLSGEAAARYIQGVSEIVESRLHALAREIGALVFLVIREGIGIPVHALLRAAHVLVCAVQLIALFAIDLVGDFRVAWNNYQTARKALAE